uniref:GH25 family protein n=1 Tax=Parastrongyloides trichosuri TaxID=131310 RepID=A0A0N4Z0V0_PARTI
MYCVMSSRYRSTFLQVVLHKRLHKLFLTPNGVTTSFFTKEYLHSTANGNTILKMRSTILGNNDDSNLINKKRSIVSNKKSSDISNKESLRIKKVGICEYRGLKRLKSPSNDKNYVIHEKNDEDFIEPSNVILIEGEKDDGGVNESILQMEGDIEIAALTVLLIIGSSQYALATIGLDAIAPMSSSTFKCLYNDGYRFFIARAWESVGNYDYTGIQNIKNARAAGWEYVDAYIFPCLSSACASAANQVEATINKLKEKEAKIGTLWLDIERYAWPADHAHNRKFITDMVDQAEKMKVKVGIYSNYYNWEAIVGLDYTAHHKLPLWWADYNGHQDFTGYSAFGGWSKPSIHQYTGDVQGGCSVDLDQSWRA